MSVSGIEHCLDVQAAVQRARSSQATADGFADSCLISRAIGILIRRELGNYTLALGIADDLARKYRRFLH